MLQDGLFFCRTHLEPPGISKKPNPSLAYSAIPADSSFHHWRRALCHPVPDQLEFDEPYERGLRSFSVCHGVFPSRRLDSAWVYMLFVAVIGGGAYGGVHLSNTSAQSRIAMLESKNDSLQLLNQELTGEVESWKNIETSLMEFDELIRSGQKELAVERFTQLASGNAP